ncbi:MmpS family protein [Nocardia sp. CDC159]|uniref:MmpS family protein n=1 Tax=Nocardia pulmonis TaxID=2951408 RepID=A0A9X2IYU9_9NOCA|nr:MmpS family protein [Nocardia pulmonis]MCM6789053.1 MmpS family protein [Nocardia sp. CDC159]
MFVVVAGLVVVGLIVSQRRDVATAGPADLRLDQAVNMDMGDRTVTYEITAEGAATGQIAYLDDRSMTQRVSDSLPWSRQIHTGGKPIPAGVVAQSEEGALTCRILVDGKEQTRDFAPGPHAAVNCNLVAV